METLGKKLLAWNKPLLWLVSLLDLSCFLYVWFQEKYFPGEFGNLPADAPAYMHSAKQLMIWVVILLLPLVALPYYLSAAILVMSAYSFGKKAINLLVLLVTAFTYFVLGAFICW